MGCFEIFLLLSSLISLSTALRLFYENCDLVMDYSKSLETQILLTQEVIALTKEIEKLNKK